MPLDPDVLARHLATFPVEHPAPTEDVNRLPQTEHHTDTATTWTLHLRLHGDADLVRTTAEQLLATGAEALTGDYLGGDSFAEWCEPYDAWDWYAEHGRALHAYFTAPNLERAVIAGEALATSVGITSATDACISTAGDWAEQAECFTTVPA